MSLAEAENLWCHNTIVNAQSLLLSLRRDGNFFCIDLWKSRRILFGNIKFTTYNNGPWPLNCFLLWRCFKNILSKCDWKRVIGAIISIWRFHYIKKPISFYLYLFIQWIYLCCIMYINHRFYQCSYLNVIKRLWLCM